MARQTIQTHTIRVYDERGRHVGNLTDEWFVDTRDGLRHQIQDPAPTSRSLRTTRAPASRPQVECYPCPDVGRLVTMIKQGQPLPPLPAPARPRVNHLACRRCGRVPCRCGIEKPGGLDAIVALQQAQGKRT